VEWMFGWILACKLEGCCVGGDVDVVRDGWIVQYIQ